MFRLAVRLHKATGAHIAFINLSGGVGVDYRPEQPANDIMAIGEGVRKQFEEILVPAGMGDVKIFTELGRFMLAPYGALISKVLHFKHIYKEYVGLDACAAKGSDIKVIECNLRASRSFPFVSKILKRNFIDTATRIMLDAPYERPDKSEFDIDRIGVKASQFSFARLQNADPVLGVDMSSTGEVGCLGDDFNEALLNAMIATGYNIPGKNILVSSGGLKGKVDLLEPIKQLEKSGYAIFATDGTAKFLKENGVNASVVSWPDEDGENKVMDMIADHKFDLIINVPKNQTKRELTNGYRIRRGAIDHNIPLMTNVRLAKAFIEAFCSMKLEDIKIKSWQEYNA